MLQGDMESDTNLDDGELLNDSRQRVELDSSNNSNNDFDAFMGQDDRDEEFDNHSAHSSSSVNYPATPAPAAITHVPPVKPRHAPLSVFEGLHKLGVFAGPIMANGVSQGLVLLTTIAYVGRLGSAKLTGAVTLGNMMCNVTGFSFMWGLCSSLDTLMSQAYGGKMYILMGLHAQRAIVILSLLSIPVVVLWTFTGEILHYVLSIEYDTSMLAGQWAKYIVYSLWPAVFFEVLKKFLYAQQVVWPVVVSTLCGLIVNFALNAIYHRTHFISVVVGDGGKSAAEIQPGGFLMAGVSYVICQWVALLFLIVLILVRKRVLRRKYARASASATTSITPDIDTPPYDIKMEDNWPPISRSILEDWKPFLELGISGAISLFFDWGSLELVAGIAGKLNSVTLATHGIYISTALLCDHFPLSIAHAPANLAGKFLGENNAAGCKFIVRLGMLVGFCFSLFLVSVLVFFLRPYWASYFTNVKEVQDMIYTTFPILLLYLPMESAKTMTAAMLRNTGRPGVTVIGNALVCLGVMLPVGYWVAVKLKYGLVGLWFTMAVSWFMVASVYFWILFTTDWQSQADLAYARNVHAAEEHAIHARGDEANHGSAEERLQLLAAR